MSDEIRIGIIGGSGLYQMDALTHKEEIQVDTPFGATSDSIIVGNLGNRRVAFIARHGRGHVLTPTEVPYRANIYALKQLGVQYILGVSACGSLREDYAPGHIVVPDQLIDFTKGKRDYTFFEHGLVAHVGAAQPFCDELRHVLADTIQTVGGTVHRSGKYITVEGPRFSTRGESDLFRQWGMDIIGMTTSPEAFLAREAEICYAVMAMVTDYDCWHEEEVTVEMVMQTMSRNLSLAQAVLIEIMPKIAAFKTAPAVHSALRGTLTTAPNAIPAERHETLSLLMQSLLG